MASLLPAVRDPQRLAALRATALVDSAPEEAFDRLTRMASRVLNVPVALVSLVDEDRQFFKSCIGLAEPWASARGTPLTHSFCQHTVQSREPLIVEDARNDPLLADNLAIPDLSVIAYAGFPLITERGEALGTFCAIDTQPRQWTDDEIEFVREMAESAMTEMGLRAAIRELEDARAEAEGALAMLHELQAIGDTGLARLDLADLLRELLGRAATTVESDAAAIVLTGGPGDGRRIRAAAGLDRRDEALMLAVADRVAAGATGREALTLAEADLAPLGPGAPDALRAAVAVPAVADGLHVATLVVGWRRPRSTTGDETKLLELAAERAAHAVHRAAPDAHEPDSADLARLERERSAAEHDADERGRLLAHVVAAQEDERRRIALDIHDDYLQAFTAVRMHLERLAEDLDEPAPRERAADLAGEMSGAIERMRGLVFDLRPPALDWAGTASALRILLDEAKRQWAFRVRLESRVVDEPSEDARVAIYRIAQEAIVNIGKHAGASVVDVTLAPRERGIVVTIRDDGRGIDTAAPPADPRHFGLAAMRERAEIAGGWWRLDSRPGEGTTVEFWVPASIR